MGLLAGIVGHVLGVVGEAASPGFVWGVVVLVVASLVFPYLAHLLPERACQVRSDLMLRERPMHVAFRWGYELGTGLYTFIVTPALLGLVAVMVGQQRVTACLVIGLAYGFARSGTVALVASYPAGGGRADRTTPVEVGRILVRLRPALLGATVLGAAGATI